MRSFMTAIGLATIALFSPWPIVLPTFAAGFAVGIGCRYGAFIGLAIIGVLVVAAASINLRGLMAAAGRVRLRRPRRRPAQPGAGDEL